jgi:hypothetical protein
LSEYAARLLLIPETPECPASPDSNVAEQCLELSKRSAVTIHFAAARLGDPNNFRTKKLKGWILWRLNLDAASDLAIASRMTPQWHLCSDVFIPIKRCHAGRGSLIGELAASDESKITGSRNEQVAIGSLRGTFRVDAVAWGSVNRGSRLVLAAFLDT